MDINLIGEIDGIEAALRIKNIREVPIIFTTSYENNETRQITQITKPIAYLIKRLILKK